MAGTSRISIKFNDSWLSEIEKTDMSNSTLDKSFCIDNLKSKILYKKDGFNYAAILIKEFPRPGMFSIDKNGFKVYDINPGCFIQSYDVKTGANTYEPITEITTGYLDTAEVNVSHKTMEVSTNESIAVFDHETGDIKRVTPEEVNNQRIPIYKKDIIDYGSEGTFDDGWFLGSVISDGYLTDRYFGYCKIADEKRERIVNYLNNKIDNIYYKDRFDEKGENKLADSKAIISTDQRVRDYIASLDMYAIDKHDALSKRVSERFINRSSREFLFGLICGMIDGDGSISFKTLADKTSLSFDFRINTSSIYLVESLKRILYKLGIKYSVSTSEPRLWSSIAYTVILSFVDVYEQLNSFKFYGIRESKLLEILKTTNRIPKDNHDAIPVSKDEAVLLSNIAIKHKDAGLYSAVVPSSNLCPNRNNILKYIDELDKNSSLYKRVINTNIYWGKVREVKYIGKQEVFDFLIPTTKVFVINDGIVVYDTISCNPILSDEANKEVDDYLNSKQKYIRPDGSLYALMTDLINLTFYNLSRNPE